jgi:hypothetical protein
MSYGVTFSEETTYFIHILKEQYCRSLIPNTTEYNDTFCTDAILRILRNLRLKPRDIVFMPTRQNNLHSGYKHGKLRQAFTFKIGDNLKYTYPKDTAVVIRNDTDVIILINEDGSPKIFGERPQPVRSRRNRTSQNSRISRRRRRTRRSTH